MPRRTLAIACVFLLTCAAFAYVDMRAPADGNIREQTFDTPIDALSVRFRTQMESADVSAFDGGQWTGWQHLAVENEQDPTTLESNMVMFPHSVSKLRFRGAAGDVTLHPIRVSDQPVSYKVASLNDVDPPRILTRADWGADPSYLVTKTASISTGNSAVPDNTNKEDNGTGQTFGESAQRVDDCNQAYAQYPTEFQTVNTVYKTPDGQQLRWPEAYSPTVRMIVVHHTAVANGGDSRSGAEKMRALYSYHANNRAWGDIGYHYVIDDNGVIYQGRAGGDFVVGGHAYCHNVGTIGIALMGNFDIENPTQKQVQSLQWLVATLVQRYNINTGRSLIYHGQIYPFLVGHRQLLDTDCPGRQMFAVLDQVRTHVTAQDVGALVDFPPLQAPSSSSYSSYSSYSSSSSPQPSGLQALGTTAIEARPGGELIIPVLFRAGSSTHLAGEKIAHVSRSPQLGILQEDGKGGFIRARSDLTLPAWVDSNQSAIVRVKLEIPQQQGGYYLKIGQVSYNIQATGRRLRGKGITSDYQMTVLPTNVTTSITQPIVRSSSSSISLNSSISSNSSSSYSSYSSSSSSSSPTIRIRLYDPSSPPAGSLSIRTTTPLSLNGKATGSSEVTLKTDGSNCVATVDGTVTTAPAIRIDPGFGFSVVLSWNAGQNTFRGILECRSLGGQLALINELPLEDYMAGIGEEPDTEPYEKQRAFAIAARTYAYYYIQSSHRKFPGMPYDGSASPAEFQLYRGEANEAANPQWLKAVRSTAGDVLKAQGQVIKAPYFSSDDGRTRSPDEAGFSNFPFASIFASKPDPWCAGMTLRGHGVGMSGCGAAGQAKEGKTAEQILQYYYPGANVTPL